MDFEYTPEQEAFRQEVRRWLEANIIPDLCVDDAMDERVAGGDRGDLPAACDLAETGGLAGSVCPGPSSTADAGRR